MNELPHKDVNEKTAAARVALIGYGIGGAVFHAPLVSSVAGLKLAAIVTRSEEKVTQARRDFPHAEIVGTAEEIFAHPEKYDLVVVCSPNRYHYAQAKAALEAGLNVVIDKPMATSAADCLALVELAKKQNKLLSVFQNRRFDGDLLTVKKILDEKLLGDVVRFESRFDRYRPQPRAGAWRERGSKEDGGGLLFDLGSHLIDQACFLFGQPLDVYCELNTRRAEVETDDDCFIALNFPSGLRAHLWASVMVRMNGPRFKLYGRKGSYEKFGLDPQEDALRAGHRPWTSSWGREEREQWGKMVTDVEGLAVHGKVETVPGCYERFYENIAACLSDPSLVPCVNPEESWRTAKIIEAAYRSATDKVVVSL
ncbi:MAG: Gfo/Idh/MocA family oxidoreductase [Cyanobacteria bacterium REEB67]|nr:Gfo/Idh/MocA family oxidoreductase [Cyanobacteria bacterium REEB67]